MCTIRQYPLSIRPALTRTSGLVLPVVQIKHSSKPFHSSDILAQVSGPFALRPSGQLLHPSRQLFAEEARWTHCSRPCQSGSSGPSPTSPWRDSDDDQRYAPSFTIPSTVHSSTTDAVHSHTYRILVATVGNTDIFVLLNAVEMMIASQHCNCPPHKRRRRSTAQLLLAISVSACFFRVRTGLPRYPPHPNIALSIRSSDDRVQLPSDAPV